MMRLLYVLVFSVALSSCTKVQEINTAEGRPEFHIDCSGGALTWSNCHEAAGDRCGEKGVVVIAKTGDVLDVTEMYYGLWDGSELTNRFMIAQCRE